MYSLEKREVKTVLRNRSNRPRVGRETRWYILKDGKPVAQDSFGYHTTTGLYFEKKYMAEEEMQRLIELEEDVI